ncbi:MAG: hypothetical protein JW888_02580, partial [Pirellulales bacterium]|nr:hypothetical protein [Pirellulales bacterium]
MALAIGTATACGGTPWHEDFEDTLPSWREAGGDISGSMDRHQRVVDHAYAGQRCEWFRVIGQGGTNFYVSHNVGRPKVIPELQGSVWVKSDRAGIQVFARVVLPRTQDPRSGTPVLLRLEGTSYTQVGHWQQLRIENLHQLLARRIRGLRLQMGPQVDGREAYVDQILLNVYGGPGTTNVWVDELSLAGYVDTTSPGPSSAAVPLNSLPDVNRSAGQPVADRSADSTGASNRGATRSAWT